MTGVLHEPGLHGPRAWPGKGGGQHRGIPHFWSASEVRLRSCDGHPCLLSHELRAPCHPTLPLSPRGPSDCKAPVFTSPTALPAHAGSRATIERLKGLGAPEVDSSSSSSSTSPPPPPPADLPLHASMPCSATGAEEWRDEGRGADLQQTPRLSLRA